MALGGALLVLCGAGLLGALIFFGPGVAGQFFPHSVQVAQGSPGAATSGNTMGDPNAPVHIVEYADFQCPYCLRFWKETEPQLIEQYVKTGKVLYEYRAFPIIGPESYLAAQGAYCASDQGKFWQYHDTLFSNWTGENAGDFTQDRLHAYAVGLKLDLTAFDACMKVAKYSDRVKQDQAQGEKDGVLATPTFIINGQKVEGAQPFDVIKQIIDHVLKGDFSTQSG